MFQVVLFWNIYVMDRNNSFRLGHQPALQDCDISTPMMTSDEDYPAAFIPLMRFWVDCGRVQGKICTQLYGPAASALPADERAHIAEAFASELELIHERKTKASSCHQCSAGFLSDLTS